MTSFSSPALPALARMTVSPARSTSQRWTTAWRAAKAKSWWPGARGVGVDRREVDQVAAGAAGRLEGGRPAAGLQPVGRPPGAVGRRGEAEDVGAGAADQRVGAAASGEVVGAAPAGEGVGAGVAGEPVVEAVAGAGQGAGSRARGTRAGRRAASRGRRPRCPRRRPPAPARRRRRRRPGSGRCRPPPVMRVGAEAAVEQVGALAAGQPSAPAPPAQRVVGGVAGDAVVAAAADGVLDQRARVALVEQRVEDVAAGVAVVGAAAEVARWSAEKVEAPPGAEVDDEAGRVGRTGRRCRCRRRPRSSRRSGWRRGTIASRAVDVGDAVVRRSRCRWCCRRWW